MAPTVISRSDYLVVALIVLSVLATAALFFPFDALPHEDAAMLMRYSVNLAEGHGIRWNIDEPPVDGATDFLFMVFVAALVKAGLGVVRATQALGFITHVLTVALIILGVRKLWGISRWVAAVCGLFIAAGPGLGHIAAGFGTTFFGFFVVLTWYFAFGVIRERGRSALPPAFAFSALAMGMTRPEGVILAVLMLASIVFALGWRDARRTAMTFAVVFGILGGAYFFWRWNYFGYPLPNPFYKKGGGQLYPASLYTAVKSTFILSFPFWIIYLAAFRSRSTFRMALISLIPIGGFTLSWVFLSDEMNYLRRFQYATLPIVLLSWPGLVEGTWMAWKLPSTRAARRKTRIAAMLLVAVFLTGSVAFGATAWLTRKHRKFHIEDVYRDGRYDVALLLRPYAGGGYTLATTEAGILPLYSRWKAIDTYGLNDQWIAHNGAITDAYLERYRPEVIMLHSVFPLADPPADPDAWGRMVLRLHSYALANGYIAAAVYGETPADVHAYYVRRSFVHSDEVVRQLRGQDYRWYRTGQACENYVELPRE